ncbi:hypothetical protein RBWH47_05883 [Rhodopirellula baltica WH47]|uniref:Uncharacterized protein n=1 Tax=Rhodopirellula baltica WH47 TaxID=991778 RepID=F2AW59_RHOBT|nr:hypothetical protein RBWH47_05883 [Rhodopirellula baltica WH47]
MRGPLTSGFWRNFSDARSLNGPFRGVRIELPSEAEASSAEEQLAKE